MLLEELDRLGWMLAGDIVEGSCGDIVRLSLADQRIIFEQILQLGRVEVGLRLEKIPSFSPAQYITRLTTH